MTQPTKQLVLLHGWTPDKQVIDRLNPFKKQLTEAGFVVHLWKIPGLTTDIDHSYTIEKYLEWLTKEITPLKNIVLVGHSFGGQLATVLAAKKPELVSKLILIDSSGILDFIPSKVFKRWLFKILAKLFFFLAYVPLFKRAIYKLIRERDYIEANPAQQKTMRNVLNYSVLPLLNKITIPTLIIWGKDDLTTPLRIGKLFAKKIPNNIFKVLPARHSPVYTHPDLVVKEILSFLKKESL